MALLWPCAAWGHALHPIYYPLGHVPALLARELPSMLALAPLGIGVGACLMRWFVPALDWKGHAWRASILYLAARVGETGASFLLASLPVFNRGGMSSSMVENFVPLAAYLAAGSILAAVAGVLLYRRVAPRIGHLVLAVIAANLAGYAAGAVYATIWSMARG